MKKIDLGQTLGILANFGVVIGIVLLVYELNQNRAMMRAQIRNEIGTSLSGPLNPPVSDGDLADLMFRSDNGEELTGSENYRVHLQSEVLFRYWKNVYYQYRQGLYDGSEFSGHRGAIEESVNLRPRYRRYWCSQRGNRSSAFRDLIDGFLPQGVC